MSRTRVFVIVLMLGAGASALSAATVPFVENFVQDAAGWRNGSGSADLQWVGAGGPDGGSYASGSLNFLNIAGNGTPLVARAQDEWNSSAGAFTGNYIAEQVQQLTVWVRHDAPAPLTYFIRFSGPANFPGAIAVRFAPVPPHTWTPIAVPIDPANPQFVSFEGSSFTAVFSNVGHIQIGVFEPSAVAGQDVSVVFDVDQAALVGGPAEPVPALSNPGMALLVALLAVAIGLRFRRQCPSY